MPAQQQQPQLSATAIPNPWPPLLSADLDERGNELGIGRQELVLGVCGVVDESNTGWEIGRHDVFFLFLFLDA